MPVPVFVRVPGREPVRAGVPLSCPAGVEVRPVWVACSYEIGESGQPPGWGAWSASGDRDAVMAAVDYRADREPRVVAVAVVTVTSLLNRAGGDRAWYVYGHVDTAGIPRPGYGRHGHHYVVAAVPDMSGLRRAVESYLASAYAEEMGRVCPVDGTDPVADPMDGPE